MNLRRKILTVIGLGALGFSFRLPGKPATDVEEEEKQLMLTSDGQLVEIPKSVFQKATKKKSVRRKKHLLTWLKSKGNKHFNKQKISSQND
jgi:hypothetical protein